MDRGKRRSRSQRIGTKGEAFFLGWATDHGLSANKVGEDYGVDFFCQILRFVGKHGSEEATGAIIAVQVRTTEGATRPRIKLDRVDAVNLLRQHTPTCLVAVNLHDISLHFKFLDEDFISTLSGFLSSQNVTLAIQLKQMESDPAIFDSMLRYYTKPGTVQRLMIHKIQSDIARKIPGASLNVQQGQGGGVAVLNVPWIGSALDLPKKRSEFYRRMVFQKGKFPFDLVSLHFKADLNLVSNLVDGSVLVRGRFERDCKVTLRYEGQSVSAVFQLRVLGDEWAYSNSVGICFVVSDRRKKKLGHVHLLQAHLFKSEINLGGSVEMLQFLKCLKSGAEVLIDGKLLAPLSAWGDTIVRVGPAIDSLEEICLRVGLRLKDFSLNDLSNEEFGRALSILDAALLKNIPMNRLVHAFILGPLAEKDPKTVDTEAAIMALPIIMNLKDKGVILWGYGNGWVFVNEIKEACGIKFGEGTEWSAEVHPKFKKSKYPELWIVRGWPPIKMGDAVSEGLQEVNVRKNANVGVEAIIRRTPSAYAESLSDV